MTEFIFEDPHFLEKALNAGTLDWIPPDQKELLRGCATVRYFDRTLYEQVLQSEGTLSFDELTTLRWIERLSGPGERYQVGSLRAELFASWWPPAQRSSRLEETPVALRQFSERLVAYYTAQKDPLEALYHLVAVDRTAAARQLDALFQPALDAFDLPRCHAIVRLLEERESSPLSLGVALATRLQEKRRQLATRTMWAYEYYETIVYLERAQTKELATELIADPQHWILHLFAMGGMGKTMFIRAVIARYCVPRGIPCARIDFDFVPHIAHIAREPWRLLLHIAEQLDRQLPNAPFSGLLVSYAPFAAETSKRRIVSPRAFVAVSQEVEQATRQTVIDRFIDILRENGAGRPLLLIFDTLENLRSRQLDLTDAFDLLKRLHDQYPQLRVILAGRFDLAEAIATPDADPNQFPDSARLSGYVERFKGQERTVKLNGFSRTEAQEYLAVKRGLADDLRLTVILDKSMDKGAAGQEDKKTKRQGEEDRYNPFKLALLADIVTANPKLTTSEIADYANVDLVYLIERVVERIEDLGVRWLLRYGVAPRQLTLDFVRNVALPYLTEAIQGHLPYDNPQADRLPAEVLKRHPFAQDKNRTTLDVDALWQTLYGYCSGYSWVWSSNAMTNAVVFHPDVIAPMRRLLRERDQSEQDIYLRLHRDAMRYFAELAEREPTRRAQWLSEAVYHKYRSEESDADIYWRQQWAAAGQTGAVAQALAEAVLNPLPVDQDLLISPAIKALAAYTLARATLESAVPLTSAALFQVHEWLTWAEQWNMPLGDEPTTVLAPSQLEYLRAYLARLEGQKEQALRLCENALTHPADAQNELDLCLLHGDVLTDLAQPSALTAYRHAWTVATANAPERRTAIAPRLVVALMKQEQFDEVIALQQPLFTEALAAQDLDRAAHTLLSILQAQVALGYEGEAVRTGKAHVERLAQTFATTTDTGPNPVLVKSWLARLRAELALARHLPDTARLELQQLKLDELEDTAPTSILDWQIALADLRARTAILQFDVPNAETQLENLAYDLYGPTTYKGGLALLQLAQLWLDPVRDPEHTAADLRKAADFITHEELKVRWQLLEIQRCALAGEQAQAFALAQALATNPDQPIQPSLRILVALEYAIQSGLAATPCAALLTALQRVTRPTQRLALLDGLQRCPTPPHLPAHLTEPLLALLPTANAHDLDPALAALRLAHVQRVLGQENQARTLLYDAERACQDPLRLEILRAIWRSHDQLGWLPSVLATWEINLRRRRSWKANPLSAALILLEHAERLYRVLEDVPKAQALLAEAREVAGSTVPWQRRLVDLEQKLTQRGLVSNAPSGGITTGPISAQNVAGRDINSNTLESAGGVADMGDYIIVSGVRLNKRQEIPAAAPTTSIFDEGDALTIGGVRLQKRQVDPAAPTLIEMNLSGQPDRQLRMVAVEWAQEGQIWDYGCTLPDALRQSLQLRPQEAVNHTFLRQFDSGWQALGEQLSEQLLSPALRARLMADQPYDAVWAASDPQLAWLPWELLLLHHNRRNLPLPSHKACRYFYRPLPNASVTVNAHRPKAPVDVLVIRLGEQVERQITRGFSQLTGDRLLDLYRRVGLTTEEVSEADFERLLDVLDRMQPAIVHLTANLRDEGQRIFIDLEGDQRLMKSSYLSSNTSRLSPREIGLALQRVHHTPLLILDPPAPPGDIERLRQLCLRNAFAAELARTERPPTILGVGLGETGYEQQALAQTIAERLARGETIGAVVSNLQRAILDGQHDILAFAGAALFTADPDRRFIQNDA